MKRKKPDFAPLRSFAADQILPCQKIESEDGYIAYVGIEHKGNVYEVFLQSEAPGKPTQCLTKSCVTHAEALKMYDAGVDAVMGAIRHMMDTFNLDTHEMTMTSVAIRGDVKN
jgi:hypothetical protein